MDETSSWERAVIVMNAREKRREGPRLNIATDVTIFVKLCPVLLLLVVTLSELVCSLCLLRQYYFYISPTLQTVCFI